MQPILSFVLIAWILPTTAAVAVNRSNQSTCDFALCASAGVNGSKILKDESDWPETCFYPQNCMAIECCADADQCRPDVCAGANTKERSHPLNTYCIGEICAERECCDFIYNISQAVTEGDTVIFLDDVSKIGRGDTLSVADWSGIVVSIKNSPAPTNGTNTSAGRRLTGGTPGSVSVDTPLTQSAADSLNSGVTLKQSANSAIQFVGGDPITFAGGRKIKFWLPLYKLSLLLVTPDLKMFGGVFAGPLEGQQWFDRFVLEQIDGTKLADVSVIRGERLRNRTASQMRRKRYFEQLEIKLSNAQRPLQELRTDSLSSLDGNPDRFWHSTSPQPS